MIKFIPMENKEEKKINEIQYGESPIKQFIPDLGRSPIRKAFPDNIIQKAYCL